jgi:hypothetical protein
MRLRLSIVALVSMALAGCGSDPGGTDTDATGTTGEPLAEVPFAEFHVAAEEAYCEWQVACHQYGVPARCHAVNHMEARVSMRELAGVGTDEATPAEYLGEAIEVGRIVYDAELAATCLAYVRARSCEYAHLHAPDEAELRGQEACLGVFSGRMGRNGPCLSASECAEASICGFDPNATEMCAAGACRVLPVPAKLGEACTNSVGCELDHYCASDPDSGASTVCTAAPGAGEPCVSGACASGLYCDYEGDAPICREPKAPGASCYGATQCAQPGLCVYGPDDFDAGHCVRPGDEGEPCDPDLGSSYCIRFDNYCHPASRTCTQLPDKGELCQGDWCRGDLFCSQLQGGRCTPVADAGEPCGPDPQYIDDIPCSGDHYCDYAQQPPLCLAPAGEAQCSVPPDPVPGA